MRTSPKIPRIASIVAFVMTGLVVVSALMGQMVLLAFAVIPLAAGIGILRRRVWSAYGFALYLFAQLLLMPFVLIRSGGLTASVPETIASIALTLVLAVLFLLAGRSLVAAGSRRGWAAPWIAVSAVFTIPVLFVQPFVIPTSAMEDTLLIGDRILVRCFPAPSVVHGDIVVFRYSLDRRQTYVKRVIGVPGDRIRISGKVVYRNGAVLKEPYAVHKTDYIDPYRDNFPSEPNAPYADATRDMLKNHVVNGEVVVPERSYFVLGDNRDSSLDSRYWGFVGSSDLIGKPLLIYDSEDQPSGAMLNGKGTGPRRIRWERLFRLL
jgi:signal peptidase I